MENPGSRTHGHCSRGVTPTYRSWLSMRVRCRYPKDKRFAQYGGRGIVVCARWDVFANFLADMGERPPGTTLDRRNNDRGYTKRNCRWATRTQQSGNRRTAVRLTIEGKTLHLAEWARRSEIPEFTIRSRIRLGWSARRAVFEPLRRIGRRKDIR